MRDHAVARRALHLFGRSLSLRFLVVGTFNTFFTYSLLVVFLWAGLGIASASLAALAIGIFMGYWTQGTIVFGNKSAGAFVRFVLVWGFIYCFNLAVMRGCMALGASSYLAGFVAIGPNTLLSFFLQKIAVFRV